MAAKKDKMIPSEKERKRALKYATPAGTGRMWLTPPTIEIVGFLGGGGKAYHHAAYKAASYAVSHQQLRV